MRRENHSLPSAGFAGRHEKVLTESDGAKGDDDRDDPAQPRHEVHHGRRDGRD